jgi:hypothetical protein
MSDSPYTEDTYDIAEDIADMVIEYAQRDNNTRDELIRRIERRLDKLVEQGTIQVFRSPLLR